MQLSISHETHYRYTSAVQHSIQMLRLTPRADPMQRVLRWNIQAPRRLWAGDDAYGNRYHTLVIAEPHDAIKVLAQGVVEVVAPARAGVLAHAQERLSPLAFLRSTALTEADEAVRAFAQAHFSAPVSSPEDLLPLARAIADALTYRTGVTETQTTASGALAQGIGVCQDHAHLFIACCRAKGVPARYVSGYIDSEDSAHAASHAWAQAWVPEVGWVSVDITHVELVRDRHCSLSIGQDFDSASPIRGVRTGGGAESMDVTVSVSVSVDQ